MGIFLRIVFAPKPYSLLKSGIPLSPEIPAPVRAMVFFAVRMS
jgi:hypothetical protein